MSKPFEWKFDARELMTEKYMIPKGGEDLPVSSTCGRRHGESASPGRR